MAISNWRRRKREWKKAHAPGIPPRTRADGIHPRKGKGGRNGSNKAIHTVFNIGDGPHDVMEPWRNKYAV